MYNELLENDDTSTENALFIGIHNMYEIPICFPSTCNDIVKSAKHVPFLGVLVDTGALQSIIDINRHLHTSVYVLLNRSSITHALNTDLAPPFYL